MLLRHATDLNRVSDQLIQLVNGLIRQVITEHLMTLHVAGTVVLRLGQALPGEFPQALKTDLEREVSRMLARVDEDSG